MYRRSLPSGSHRAPARQQVEVGTRSRRQPPRSMRQEGADDDTHAHMQRTRSRCPPSSTIPEPLDPAQRAPPGPSRLGGMFLRTLRSGGLNHARRGRVKASRILPGCKPPVRGDSAVRSPRQMRHKSAVLLWLFLASACARQAAQQPYDVLIIGGSVLNGDGTPAVRADVGIRGGRIATIGDVRTAAATRRIDASGLTVAPGFIDIHNHSDYTILVDPRAESMIRQGVTTMVLGESRSAGPIKPGAEEARARADGVSVDWTTLGGYFARLERQHMSTNIASYVGEEQVWTYVKGYGNSPATPQEIDQMKRLVAAAMEDGAMGLSTALLQPPSSFATTAHLIELAGIAQQYGGIYSTHIRDEGEGVFRAIDEAIQVGKGARLRVDIIHMKIAHKKLWGRAPEIVAMVERARGEGHDVRANVYPYTAGQNNLSSIVPPWAHDGGREKMLERLKDPSARGRMREEIMNGLPDWYNHYLATGEGWAGMVLVSLRH